MPNTFPLQQLQILGQSSLIIMKIVLNKTVIKYKWNQLQVLDHYCRLTPHLTVTNCADLSPLRRLPIPSMSRMLELQRKVT